MEEKIGLRKKYLRKRKELSKDFVEQHSLEIQKNFLKTNIYKKANNICIYIDYNNEVKTNYVIEKALYDGKKIYVPKIFKDNLEFIEINKNSKYITNKYKIKEPIENTPKFLSKRLSSVFLVPGVVFSEKKYRIGYGRGIL